MNKFQKIFEGNFQRYQGGGFLTGDLVRLSKDVLKSEWVGGMGGNTLEQVKKFLESDLNIRISSVKALRPAVSGSVQQDMSAGNDYYADICLEKAPGLWLDFLEIPCNYLEHIDTGINLSPIPDSQKRDNDIIIKPEGLEEEDGDSQFDPVKNTKSQEGDKNLPVDNTTLPNSSAAASYTGGYMD